MEICELDALVGQPIDMRCLYIGVTMAAHLVVALVVRENENNVGTLGGPCSPTGQHEKSRNEERA
jgi:hypothetical protein